ncbi:nucleotide-sugar transporter-domain-containing protein [Pelagophyceae sp. CCMP2097]|nr:nucleotide-sugar transporter-domain-containing protein [Pelagophyceae sp. CCMP2097]|mmetsp:Transcript_25163/g.86208  ORF Transcript_25163/g.86208 Transcript_25163/m.86208 type:complete len:377 (+) Transcript_25163:42-1172(+)
MRTLRLWLSAAVACAYTVPKRAAVFQPKSTLRKGPHAWPRANVALRAAAVNGNDLAPSNPTESKGMSENLRGALILGALVLQTAGVSLLTRHACQTCAISGSAASLLQEVAKFPMAIAVLIGMGQGRAVPRMLKRAFENPRELAELAVPSACFAAQNVLYFVAHARLPATTYLVLAQSKTLWTALFSVALLPGKRLSRRQWFAQPLLAAGCALVLAQQLGAQAAHADPRQVLIGAAACVASAVVSGYANVYFERIVKRDGAGFWPRQLQLAAVTTLCTLPAMPRTENVFAACAAFSPEVWAVVMLKALGGLLIGATIKYTSSISKNFATALAIVVTAACAPAAFSSKSFVAGIALVFASMALFNSRKSDSTPAAPK